MAKSLISQEEYEIFGKRVACVELQATRSFRLEGETYPYLASILKRLRYKVMRVDTTNQIGMPDLLCLKGDEYILIEVKRLKRQKLTNILDNLHWQPGQVPFMLQALIKQQSYLLIVAKGNRLLVIGDPAYVRTMLSDTNNFGQLRVRG